MFELIGLILTRKGSYADSEKLCEIVSRYFNSIINCVSKNKKHKNEKKHTARKV